MIFNKIEYETNLGIKAGVDITPYINENLTFFQIREIRKSLICGIDPTDMIRENFNFAQMSEIRKGLEAKIDISQYFTRTLDFKEMLEKRYVLIDEKESNKNVYICINKDEQSDKYQIYSLDRYTPFILTGEEFSTLKAANSKLVDMMELEFKDKYIKIIGNLKELILAGVALEKENKIKMEYPHLIKNEGYFILSENNNNAFGYSPLNTDKFVVWDKTVDGECFWGKYRNNFNSSTLKLIYDSDLDKEHIIEILKNVGENIQELDEEMER